ncbi:MAG TPA: bacterial transcriptional activator domain-containing protein, partial [Gemmatimonadaceae bacterium]|nr:bacterial transcriptional activator domain-containing protein [Gemmatimonadaceae bacterium]
MLVGRGDEEVGVDFAAVWCDAREFERALDAGRPDEALALYRGHFLEGFHVSGVAPELGQWLDEERARLRARAVAAAAGLADEAERGGNCALAAQRLRDVLRIDPGAEPSLRRLMLLLHQDGDRAGALRVYDEFARRLATEIEAEPAADTAALAERVRNGRETTSAAAPRAAGPP